MALKGKIGNDKAGTTECTLHIILEVKYLCPIVSLKDLTSVKNLKTNYNLVHRFQPEAVLTQFIFACDWFGAE